MDSAKVQLSEKLKTANNILVTVSRDPSIDQLSACLGLALLLNKFGKHAAAVFSGEVPSTLEFLQPEETLEKTTDSLRDFIIALDKHKADKLRYKVEDDVVRIFITPYKTSISQADLEFSQGDFNVDVVIALGVQQQEDLDQAITSHGRILHDATVASITVGGTSSLGSINWNDPEASSLAELVTELGQLLDKKLFDNQIATALLTGIVAETERFSNSKTSSETMRASAVLMAAGADQQLVAQKLEEPATPAEPEATDAPDEESESAEEVREEKPPKPNDGTLEISHEAGDEEENDEPTDKPLELPDPQDSEEEHEDNQNLSPGGSRLITDKPQLGGMLTANTQPEHLDPSVDPLSLMNPNATPLLSRQPVEHKAAKVEPLKLDEAGKEEATSPDTAAPSAPALTPPPTDWAAVIAPPAGAPTVVTPDAPMPEAPAPEPPIAAPEPPSVDPATVNTEGTLADLENKLRSHADTAREEVDRALSAAPTTGPLPPKQDLNAQLLGDPLQSPAAPAVPLVPAMDQPIIDADPTAVPTQAFSEHQDELGALNLNSDAPPPDPNAPSDDAAAADAKPEADNKAEVKDPTAPPPVPPPFDPTKFSTDPTTPAAQQPKA
jgi:hypothetical protein